MAGKFAGVELPDEAKIRRKVSWAMFWYHIYAFIFPVYVPLSFSATDDCFNLPRRPCFFVWGVRAIRSLQIAIARRRLRAR